MSFTTKPKTNLLLMVIVLLVVAVGGYLLGQRASGSNMAQTAFENAEVANAEGAPGNEEAHGEAGAVKLEEESQKLANVKVETVGYGAMQSRLVATGTVEPNLSGVVKITPRISGKIISIQVNVGDSVHAGQALATLASTELAQAQAAYRQATLQEALARNNLRRQKKLAGLGTFGRPRIEEARAQAAAAQGEIDIAQSEAAAARADVSEAESQLRALQAALVQAETQVKVTQSRFNRTDRLLKEQIVSQQEWEQAQADYQHAEAEVNVAHANVAQGQAKVQTARARLEAAQAKWDAARKRGQIASQALLREESVYKGGYVTTKEIVEAESAWRQAQVNQRAAEANIRLLGGTPGGGNLLSITAPLEGRITERLVTLGETVTPEKALFTILNLRTVWVQANVFEKDIHRISVSQPATIIATAFPNETFRGTVSYISDTVDPKTRTVAVRCVIANPQNKLKPEMFVQTYIIVGRRARALVVPERAVQTEGDKTFVYVAEGEGRFERCEVQLGEVTDGMHEVISGLKAGDRIVTEGSFLLKSESKKEEFGEHEH